MNQNLLFTLFFLACFGTTKTTYAQELIPFDVRYTNNDIRGNLTITGNDIVGILDRRDDNIVYDPNAAFNTKGPTNGRYTTAFIDVDGDPTTFSSSSADLTVPDDACSNIVYAGLYWSANYYMARNDDPDELDDNEITPDAVNGGEATNTGVSLVVNNGPFAQSYTARYAQFDNDNSDIQFSPVTSYLVVAQPVNGCGITNAAALAGNIAVIRKDNSCNLRQKVVNAQQAGAVGVVIVNDVDQDLPRLDGNGATAINIPSVSVGDSIRDGLDVYRGDLITLLNNFNGLVLGTLSTTGNGQIFNLPANDPRKQGPADFRDIKFKVPGGAYVDITNDNGRTQTIWDGYAGTATNTQTDGNGNPRANDEVQYVCYADVTDLIDPAMPFGTYTVANMNATQGYTSTGDGACGGWMLVVVYEDPLQSSKFIDTRDGYVQVFNGGDPEDFKYNGFTTLPGTQPVDVLFGVASLEGDSGFTGDQLQIRNTSDEFVSLGTGADVNGINPTNNFFNSSITRPNAVTGLPEYINPRNPNSENTMGFDADLFGLPNAGNTLIENDQTEATFRLFTDTDRYSVFFGAFSVTINKPEILLLDRVFDREGVIDITGGNLELGDEIVYDLELQNIGNEDFAEGSVEVTANINTNVTFMEVIDPLEGVTFIQSSPRTIVFSVPSELLETDKDGEGISDEPINIRFKAVLVPSCETLRDACSDVVDFDAHVMYTGELSGTTVVTDSRQDFGFCRINPGESSNILVNVPPCQKEAVICDTKLTLVADPGYDQYTWSGPGINTAIVQISASNPNANVLEVPFPETGTYLVVKEDTDTDPTNNCMTLKEEFTVRTENDSWSPFLNEAIEVLLCTVTNESYPVIAIEGGIPRELSVTLSGVTSIAWQKLDTSGCEISSQDNCPIVDPSCEENWGTICEALDCSISEDGEYRILVTTNECELIYYFRARSGVLANADLDKTTFTLYPNPTKDVVQLVSDAKGFEEISLLDLSGKIVMKSKQSKLDISSLSRGVYFVRVEDANDTSILKLIKE